MTGTLTVDSAAELAATLAHTSALIDDRDAGYPPFTTLTPHLAAADRRHHWERLLDAASRQLALDDPPSGAAAALDLPDSACAAGIPTLYLLDVDPEQYRGVDPADRPGENDYDGYDIAALTLDLASAWDAELLRRSRRSVNQVPLPACLPIADR